MENNFLPTQHTEISEALAHNVSVQQETTELGPKRPKVGLLTQTMIPSPTIQFVLPARLRRKFQNDVVFVGERSLLLREIVMDSYLEDVTVNSDFDANIMAVKAIRLVGDIPLDVQMRLGVQDDFPEEAQTAEEMPDHLLVLTLDSKELIFLYYHCNPEGQNGRFVHFRRPLPSDVSIAQRFGCHLAVDPKSRAVAVAAPANFFGVFSLKSSEELQSQMRKEALDPIMEERFFGIDGDIIFMDFLYPETENENKIVLLFIVARGSDTLAICYDWDSADTLRQARPKVVIRKLPGICRLPSLLVPLTKSTSFLIVTTSVIVAFTHVTASNMKFIQHPITGIDPSFPMTWTKWARPYRHQAYNKSHDVVYLCREDGLLSYVDINDKGVINGVYSLGWLGCDVDGAFDTIDFSDPSHGGDLLLAAGNTGHGGLFIQTARQSPACVQKFVNWAPILDAALVPSPLNKPRQNLDLTEDVGDSHHLYVCSASSNGQGAVHEFRYGCEAQIGWIVPLEDLSSTRSMWCMPDVFGEGTYLLVSDPITSTLLYLPRNDGEEIYAMDDLDTALDSSIQTLAAGYTLKGVLVQVTSNSVRLTVPGDSMSNVVSNFQLDQTVLISAVNSKLSLFVVALRSDQAIKMRVGQISIIEGSPVVDYVGDTLDIDYEPTSILIDIINEEIFVFMGSSEGRIDSYRLHQNEVRYLGGFDLRLREDHLLKVIESMALLTGHGTNKAALFCGLRSGLLVPIDVTLNIESSGNSIDAKQYPYRRLGQTVVKLSRKDEIVLATCGSGFWCISGISNIDASDFDLHQIWITDQNNPSYVQKSVDVFTVIDTPRDPSSTSLDGSLVCISDGQLLICTLNRCAKAIPRKIDLPGCANRVAYSEYLQSLVVAYTKIETVKNQETGLVERYTRPYLDFISLATNHSDLLSSRQGSQDSSPPQLWRPSGSSGERVTCILDWTPEHDGQKYHFIVVGTARRTGEHQGRIVFLHTRRSAANHNQVECSVKYIHPFDGPVRAIAAYGDCTLMVASGNDIIPIEPELPNRKKQWVASARFKLTSPGVSITVHDTFLYVSTARESLVILQVVNNKLELHAHDGARHEGLSHYRIGGEFKLVLSSRRGGKINLFSEAGVTNTDKLLSPAISEANLPLSIIRLNPCTSPSTLHSSTAVYGTTMDGTIYRVMTTNEKEWRLLRFVQNLCSRDPTVSPFLSARKSRWTWTDMIPQANKPSQMHIDGDILSRLLKYGADHLRDILNGDTRSLQVDASAAIPSRSFIELFEEFFGEVLNETPLQGDAVSQFITWLQKLLQPRI